MQYYSNNMLLCIFHLFHKTPLCNTETPLCNTTLQHRGWICMGGVFPSQMLWCVGFMLIVGIHSGVIYTLFLSSFLVTPLRGMPPSAA